MIKFLRVMTSAMLLTISRITIVGCQTAMAESASGLDRDSQAALLKLYDSAPAARDLAKTAKASLMFPNIVKTGFLVGAEYGDGALIKHGKRPGYYHIVAASYGLQAGVQSSGWALFL